MASFSSVVDTRVPKTGELGKVILRAVMPVSHNSREKENRLQRISEIRSRLIREGPPWTRSYANDFDSVALPERDCDAVRDLLINMAVEKVVEVGLAYGSSALAIGEALITVGAERPTHVIIDPLQESEWSNVGWQVLRSAALDEIARLVEQPSSLALPQLVVEGFAADAAFVDGSHRFHEVFVDLYFLRKTVRAGGIIILDDYWWPSVRTAAQYFEKNLGWQTIPEALDRSTVDEQTGCPRVVAFRLPDRPFEPEFKAFEPF